MAKFQDTLDKLQEEAESMIYQIRNPTKEYGNYSDWVGLIINNARYIKKYQEDLTNKYDTIADPEELNAELEEYYGENSDGTYEDFVIPN